MSDTTFHWLICGLFSRTRSTSLLSKAQTQALSPPSMEEDEDMTPFWLQATTSSTVGRIRRRSSSFLLNSGVLLIILLVIAAAFIFIIIPSFLSFTSQIFRPHLVKKSWDTLNLVLVLFAIVCGFLSQNNTSNETPRSASSPTASPSFVQKPSFESLTPRRGWFSNNNSTNGGLNRLRSFSSYPDLRAEEASWMTSESDHPPWRFYDDTRLYNYRYSSLKDQPFNQFKPEEKLRDQREGVVEEVVKRVDDDISGTTTTVVEAEKKVVYTPPPAPPLSQSPPAPPLPKVVRRATAYQKVAKRSTGESTGKVDEDLGRVNRFTSSPPPPPRPSSPPPQMDDRESRNEKKRGATSATKDFLTSLRRNKKKKQRQKSVENLDIFFNYESSYPFPPPPPSQPPPPPPPPPPPNFIQNLFSQKKRKTKKIHSAPPPPPPPPPPQKTQLYSSSASKPKLISQNVTKNLPSTTHKPPLPVKIKSHNNVEETVSSGNESPLMGSIPPPPPLPPFNMPVWKFEVVERDFVRLKSHNDSDFDEANAEESSSPSEAADLATSSPLFCPSPDVNTKADKFIARFRAGLELERINSAKERGKSNLSPS